MEITTETSQPAHAYQKAMQLSQNGHQVGATPVPIPVPVPVPLVVGSQILIWKQDPTVTALGVRPTFIPSLILDGPRDARINTVLPGTTPVHGNTKRDFIFAPGTAEFDCAHTFAIVRETLTMYQRALGGAPLPWAWNTAGNIDAINVFPQAGVTPNAFYSRAEKALKFFFFVPTGASQPIFTCRSLDIVAHECGHAVLDGLKPGWLGPSSPQTGGLHEAFGDITALFLSLHQLDQVEAAIALTKANLHGPNFLAALAEQFGAGLGLPQGLRNADNDLKLSQVGNEVHAISQVFTGGVYDTLADIFAFERQRQATVKDPARVLLEVASSLLKVLMEGIRKAPASNASYADVVNGMLSASQAQGEPPIYRTFLRSRFTFREVVVSPTPLTAMLEGRMEMNNPGFTDGKDDTKLEAHRHPSDRASQDRSRCCGTMQRPEFVLADAAKLQSGQAMTDEDLLSKEAAELHKRFN